MSTVLRLTVLTGPHKNTKYCMCPAGSCIIGRGDDCPVRLSGTPKDQFISRHHCQLDYHPTSIAIKDLGSANGTFLNGKSVASVTLDLEARDGQPRGAEQVAFTQGDMLTVGGTTLQIDVVECAAWQAGETVRAACPAAC
jgi:pSer/pThr/pTyr-binding forkhead associated (FHA) protein